MDAMTRIALGYLDQGFSVVPCHVPLLGGCTCGRPSCSWPGKHPRIPWRPYTERLPTEDEVIQWFDDEFYGSNVGIVTGQVSRIAVVDVDGPMSAFEELGLPKTLEAITGSGGRHYYYRTKTAIPSRIGMVPGIDLKGDGGFVVAPPSRHVSGRKYMWRWTVSPRRLDPDQLPEGTVQRPLEPGWYDVLLEGVDEGDRSNVAARLAGRYASLGLTPRETYYLLKTWNEDNRPPIELDQLRQTVRAVHSRHAARNGDSIGSMEDIYNLVRNLTGREGDS